MTPLTPERASEIGRALDRYKQIGSSTIINPRDEAELTGLKNFFSTVMVEHGSEFMGCWMAIRTEYEPLVQVIERISSRIIGIRQNREAEVKAQATEVKS